MDRHVLIDTLKEHWLSEDELPWLERLDDDALEGLHAEVMRHAKRVEEAEGSVYRVMATTTKFIPNFMLGKFSKSLGPYVVAQITRHLDSKAAASMSKSLEPAFLGDVAVHLDVQKTSDIVTLTPIDRVTVVVERMSDRGLHQRLGELADALDPDVLNALTSRLGDPERVASIAAAMHNTENLAAVGRSLKPKVLDRIVRVLEERGNGQIAQLLVAARR